MVFNGGQHCNESARQPFRAAAVILLESEDTRRQARAKARAAHEDYTVFHREMIGRGRPTTPVVNAPTTTPVQPTQRREPRGRRCAQASRGLRSC